MSYEDLLSIREKKRQTENKNPSPIESNYERRSLDTLSDWTTKNNNNDLTGLSGRIDKKYLIVTYVAEFDKVHYPLKLNYKGCPDVTVIHETIFKLKAEVEQLRITNRQLKDQLQTIPPHSDSIEVNYRLQTDESSDPFISLPSKSKSLQEKHSQMLLKKLKSLASHVRKLEEDLQTERRAHSKVTSKLQAENDHLRSKIRSIQTSECLLQQKVGRLESALALNVGLDRNARLRPSIEPPSIPSRSNYPDKGLRVVGQGQGSQPVSRINSLTNSRINSLTNSRCSSMGSGGKFKMDFHVTSNQISRTQIHPNLKLSGSAVHRSSSYDKKTGFDPTDYIAQKKLKQQLAAELRVARIESRIQHETKGRGKKISTAKISSPSVSVSVVSTTGGRQRSASDQGLGRMSGKVRNSGDRSGRPSTDSFHSSSRRVNSIKTKDKRGSGRTSPSPSRIRWLHDDERPHLLPDRKGRVEQEDDFGLLLERRSTLDQLLENVNKPYSHRKEGSLRKHERSKAVRGVKGSRDPSATSSRSLDQVQRKLQTLHSFLGKSRKFKK